MGEERRVFERKSLKGPARIVLTGTPSMIVRMFDISLGGACVISDSNIPAKKSFQLEFNILVRKTSAMAGFRAPVVVTHVSFSNSEGGFRIGLQFLNLTDLQRHLIVQYLDLRPAKPAATTAETTQAEEPQTDDQPEAQPSEEANESIQ